MRFCTIAEPAELPAARSLAERIATHHPDARLSVLVVGAAAPADPEFDVLKPADLRIAAWHVLEERFDGKDLAHLYPPHLLGLLLDDGDDPLVYLAPEHELLAPMTAVEEQLHRAAVLLSARVSRPLPDDLHHPSNEDLRAQGTIDPAFVATRPADAAHVFLGWWAERVLLTLQYLGAATSQGRPGQGRRQLRRILDIAPALHDGVRVLDDSGTEVSAWNLHERRLARSETGLTAGGRSLISLNLSGFRPDRPHLLAAHATRVTPARDEVLAAILDDYAQRLRDRGWQDRSLFAQVGRRLPNGLVFSERLRLLHATAIREGEELGDVFTPEGAERFMAWLLTPTGPGAHAGVNRYLAQVYRDRPDIPVAYPDLSGTAGRDFVGWAWVFGRRELDIPEAFLPPPPPELDVRPRQGTVGGVNVAGYFTGTLGLGEAARLYVEGLRAANVPVRTTTVDAQLPVGQQAQRRGYGSLTYESLQDAAEPDVNLICVNAEELPRFARDVGDEFFAGRLNLGVWAWETDVVPPHWQDAMSRLDEIWVYSRYIAENLARAAPIPVVVVPPPVNAPPAGREPDLGLPAGFRFMFMFDLFSTVERKNPVAVIEAFKLAFAPGEGPQLIVKTIHGDYRPAAFEELVYAASGRPDVHIVDEALSVEEKNGLLASCDCYVSLHRSEGWGLPLAECMAMGKPVIATGFSGNLDFMRPSNSYLVDYELTQVGAEVEIYPAAGTWADPSVEDAAARMREVWEDQDTARRRGERAARDIAELLGPHRAGQIARDRLEYLASTTGAASDSSSRGSEQSPRAARRRARRVVRALASRGRLNDV